MPAYLLGGQKGGTAKTTTAANLAIMLSLVNEDVILIDCDTNQSSSHKYIEHRKTLKIQPFFPCVQIQGNHLYSEIDELTNKFKYVVIDAGGQDSVELRSALVSQTLKKAYSPFQPSTLDLETIEKMSDLVENSKLYNRELSVNSFLTRASTNPSLYPIIADAENVLKSINNIDYSNIILYERIAYQYARSAGLSVVEFERFKINQMTKAQASSYVSKASQEICQLFKHVFEIQFDYEAILPIPLIKSSKI